MKQIKRVGILTAGGDCPGLNAAIRGVGKALLGRGIEAVGIRDGFLGLIENRTLPLDSHALAGILTVGGTILGTSRVKPHRLELKGRIRDVRDQILANCSKNRFDAVVCIGGDGTQKNAIRLAETRLDKRIGRHGEWRSDRECTGVEPAFGCALTAGQYGVF